jgi:hypothetical protein
LKLGGLEPTCNILEPTCRNLQHLRRHGFGPFHPLAHRGPPTLDAFDFCLEILDFGQRL